ARVDENGDATVGDEVGVGVVVRRQGVDRQGEPRDVRAEPGYTVMRVAAHGAVAAWARSASAALNTGSVPAGWVATAATTTSGSTPRPSQVAPSSGARTPVAIHA